MVLHYKGRHEISHSGTTAGYNAWLGRYPDQGLSVAVLCNSSAANGTQLGHAVADVFLGDAPPGTTRITGRDQDRDVSQPARSLGGAGGCRFAERVLRQTACASRSEMDGGTWYEWVEPWTPAPADLASLAGEYSSDEAEVTLRVALEHGAPGDPPPAERLDSVDADISGRFQFVDGRRAFSARLIGQGDRVERQRIARLGPAFSEHRPLV